MHNTQEVRVLSLGREDPLEEGVATHSSIPAWRIPWMWEVGDNIPQVAPAASGRWLTAYT